MQTGIVGATLVRNIEWATFLFMAVLFARTVRRGDGRPATTSTETPTLVVLAAAMAAVAIAGAKPGAGPYHLMPFIPVIAFLMATEIGTRDHSWLDTSIAAPGFVAAVAVATAIAVAQQTYLVRTMMDRIGRDELGDIDAFARSHSGVIELGYGRTESRTLERPLLTFRNNAYFIDQPAVREYQLQGIAFPPATIDALTSCRVDYWLISKGETPFSGVNVYPMVLAMPLYPESFRQAFFSTYERVDATAYFDVWRCRRRQYPPT